MVVKGKTGLPPESQAESDGVFKANPIAVEVQETRRLSCSMGAF